MIIIVFKDHFSMLAWTEQSLIYGEFIESNSLQLEVLPITNLSVFQAHDKDTHTHMHTLNFCPSYPVTSFGSAQSYSRQHLPQVPHSETEFVKQAS